MRELLSNASDALEKQRFREVSGEAVVSSQGDGASMGHLVAIDAD